MQRNSYSLLQVVFASIVTLAPLVYGLIRNNVQASLNGLSTFDSQGFVIMFLLAGGLVLWGAIGQVLVLGVLIEEFVLSGILRHSIGLALQLLAGFLCTLLHSLWSTVTISNCETIQR